MIEIIAPQPNKCVPTEGKVVFLGGSIEMGKADNWQWRVVEEFKDYPVTFLNPRRLFWDTSWEQTVENPQFVEQVNWEIYGLKSCDIRVFYFDINTTSPITLLELGLSHNSCNVIVCCPDGYYRKGNVEIVCQRYGISLVHTFDDLICWLKRKYKIL